MPPSPRTASAAAAVIAVAAAVIGMGLLLAAAPSLAGAPHRRPEPAPAEPFPTTVHVPRNAAIASVTAGAGEMHDLCGPGQQIRVDASGWTCVPLMVRTAAPGLRTYQTFEGAEAPAGAPARFRAACLDREDRVIGGACVVREGERSHRFTGGAVVSAGFEAFECSLDAVPGDVGARSAVGVAVCLDVPPAH